MPPSIEGCLERLWGNLSASDLHANAPHDLEECTKQCRIICGASIGWLAGGSANCAQDPRHTLAADAGAVHDAEPKAIAAVADAASHALVRVGIVESGAMGRVSPLDGPAVWR